MQFFVSPLHLLDHIEGSVHDELVHVSCFITEACNAITTAFCGAELQFEERIVACADDGEIVGHICEEDSSVEHCLYYASTLRLRCDLFCGAQSMSSSWGSQEHSVSSHLTEGQRCLILCKHRYPWHSRGLASKCDAKEPLIHWTIPSTTRCSALSNPLRPYLVACYGTIVDPD